MSLTSGLAAFSAVMLGLALWQGHLIDKLSEENERLRWWNDRFRDYLDQIGERGPGPK